MTHKYGPGGKGRGRVRQDGVRWSVGVDGPRRHQSVPE